METANGTHFRKQACAQNVFAIGEIATGTQSPPSSRGERLQHQRAVCKESLVNYLTFCRHEAC